MTELKIELSHEEFLPNETIKGKIIWHLQKPPETITLNIGWYTEGRGTEDAHIEYERQWSMMFLTGDKNFMFKLPPSPYSFSGKLIELLWYVSVETKKGNIHTRTDIIVSPNKKTVMI